MMYMREGDRRGEGEKVREGRETETDTEGGVACVFEIVQEASFIAN